MDELSAIKSADAQCAKTTKNDFARLESLALQRMQQGLALPPEVYALPYRDQLDWSKFPAWARPTDPELFNECGHEG
jgi:hypothetical protein